MSVRIAGIIAEYNPFHNGHMYHIRRTREMTGCDYVVVCMAGSFTQRGEAACLDKFSRVRAALCGGADAVFELPALFAVRTAEVFARGGVEILGGIGCDEMSFGCETEDGALLERLAQLRTQEPAELSREIQRGLAAGKSHPRARGEAMAAYLGTDADLLNRPNTVLAAEYIRAMKDGGFDMRPVIVPRVGDYHSASAQTQYASAGAIRGFVRAGDVASVAAHVPPEVLKMLRGTRGMHEVDDLLLWKLRHMTEADAAGLIDVREGLERRLLKCAGIAAGREELIELVKCKRYTYARISRLCAHALLDMTQALADRHAHVGYARLLGMGADAAPLLRELKARSTLPIVSDPCALRGDEVFETECRATDLRALLCNAPEERRAGADYTHPFVRVGKTLD